MTFTEPIPFDEAIAIARRKGLLPTSLTSAQLSNLSAQLKQRAVFSARLDKASVLQVLQDQITKIVSNQGIADENGRLRSIPEAKSQLREAMARAGVRFAAPGQRPIRDFYSDARRQLMVETNVLDTLGAGRHIAGNDPVALAVNPAWELVRFGEPKGGPAAERDWPARWQAALDTLSEEDAAGCTDGGERMVALKNNPIWQALGDGAGDYHDTLGNPWPPFAFNSGMNVIDVPRDECIELGLLEDDETPERDDSIDINESVQASAGKFSGALRAELTRDTGLTVLDGVLKLIGNRAAGLRQRRNRA